ncbi:MAG: Verru_Chthon cassette protein A [Verrucomicrobiaceae bacterium]|nr:Verru_Chthon cassette protein A [Verrucomicrobiaceae bacterium]
MNRKLLKLIHTRRGLALISVLAMVTLATVIVLALFSVSDSEFKASKVYAGGNAARQFADTAVNVTIGQIRSATILSTTPSAARIWASQPGAIRVYRQNGTFWEGFKLYSDSQMVVQGTPNGDALISQDTPDSNWDTTPDRYVDLNEPVIRAGQGGGIEEFFPIADPRASAGSPTFKKVEGFSYSAVAPSGQTVNGVVVSGSEDSLRLPMPVEWLYVLKDGSVGTVGATNEWIGVATAPTADNPIVGRVAFWADDECSKLNINTASEPGYWAVPTFFHERDKGWVDSPPAMNECQRFPGHPATVALSTVLYSSGDSTKPRFLDTYTSSGDLAIKESIYDVVPKIASGGSHDGTSVFIKDDADDETVEGRVQHKNKSSYVAIVPADGISERLYASLDEFMFSQKWSGVARQENLFTLTNITPSVLEKTRFFMTAHSRAPELNIFGRPRIAMWPVPDDSLGKEFRTGYDGAVAFVATLGNTGSTNTYYFSRKNADTALQDIGHDAGGSKGLQRNLNLMSNYLDKLMTTTFPGGSSFATKYGADSSGQMDYRQILVEIFDYIRCTNLYDSFLAPKISLDEDKAPTIAQEGESGGLDYRWESSPPNTRWDGKGSAEIEPGKGEDRFKLDDRLTAKRSDDLAGDRLRGGKSIFHTYTEPRFKVTKFRWEGTKSDVDLQNEVVASGAYPGHGQVTPAQWSIGGKTYKGFGRFPTISEVGMQFICTADGLNDRGSYRLKSAGGWTSGEETENKRAVSGGRTAEKIDFQEENNRIGVTRVDPNTAQDVKDYWYSNFPPFPTAETVRDFYGCTFKANYGRGDDTNPVNHPGCDPRNWNATLDREAPPLSDKQKRVQVALIFEFFVPSVGFTRYAPEWTLVVSGADGIKVQDVASGKKDPVFSTTDELVLKSNTYFSGSRNGYERITSGAYPLGGATSPQATTVNRRVKSVRSMPEDPGYDNAATSDTHAGLSNYPFVGSFFTVDRVENLKFYVEKPLKAKIYPSHDWQAYKDAPVQEIDLRFPATGEAPPPELIRYSIERRREETFTQEVVDACRWWTFHWGGALNRWQKAGNTTFPTDPNATGPIAWNVRAVDKTDAGELSRRTRGRFNDRERGSIGIKYDADLTSAVGGGNLPVSGLMYGYAPAGGFNGVRSRPQDRIRKDMDYYQPGGLRTMGTYRYFGSDTVRSIIPKYGDYRLIAARPKVPGDMWMPHPLYSTDSFFAHNFSSFFSTTEPGFYRGGNSDTDRDTAVRLVQKTTYRDQFIPDTPQTVASSNASNRYGDFDNGPGDCRDGAYINKPDEGNLSAIITWWPTPTAGNDGKQRYLRNAYLHDQWLQLPARESFFTPNRMISSPGMFGSLPTGVYGSLGRDPDASVQGQAWRTLLFRPHTDAAGTGLAAGVHPGAPATVGGTSPADHYIMDLFWMPVVSPYALSDSWATAGKINMNFQIVPFNYINRATGMYAAMKGELITAIPKTDATINAVPKQAGGTATRSYKEPKDNSSWPIVYFSDMDQQETLRKYWHRRIDLKSTTDLMKARMDINADVPFASQGLFRSASQICEVYLVPETISKAAVNPGTITPGTAQSAMSTFWQLNAITGDNVRERPYANLYQKLTTRSNTFRVHYRAQALKKARSLSPTTVRTVASGDSSTDSVVAEYRGSALIERYLDMTATGIPDYAGSTSPMNQPSLENFYRYRVIESKQFTP